MDPGGFFSILDNDEDENTPEAAAVDAFAAVLKGDLGGAAHAAAAYGVTPSGNGNVLPAPQSPATSVSSGHTGSKAVPVVSLSSTAGQQQLLWNQLSPEQQRDFQRRVQHQQQQLRMQHQQQQIQQQPLLQNQQQQQQESGSSSSGSVNKKSIIKEGISFTALMPLLQPHLPPEQGEKLSQLYQQFKRNEITREDFIRGARVIAGDQVLVQTIRQMHLTQQLQQQQRQQQQRLQQQQQSQAQGQHQPQASQPQSSHPQQQLPQSAFGSSATPTLLPDSKRQQQQQQPPDLTKILHQQLPSQMTQPPSQPQEPTITNASHQNLPLGHTPVHPFEQTQVASVEDHNTLHPPGHPFQQTQVPSIADRKTLPQGSQPQAQALSAVSQAHLQSAPVKQGNLQQDPGEEQQLNHKTAASILSTQIKHEVEKSVASLQSTKQPLPSAMFPPMQPRTPTSAAHQLQTTMVTGTSQTSQSYVQTGLPQKHPPGKAPGLPQLQLSQPVPQTPGPVTLPQPQPAPQAQPQPVKPLSKYAKSKIKKQQRKLEEDERQRKVLEEERLKKLNDEENLKKLQSTPSGMVTAAHQGLHSQHPQLSTLQLASPLVELNKPSYNHHPGSLSHPAQVHNPVSQIDTQQVGSQIAGGLRPTGQGQSLVPVKQEPSDLQSEQKKQSLPLAKGSDLLPGQALQKPAGLSQLSEAAVQPATQSSHLPVQSPNPEQVLSPQGSMPLSSPKSASSLAQQAGMAAMPAPGGVPVPPIAGSSGVHSALSMKQVGGQQRMGAVSPAVPANAAYNATSLPFLNSFNSTVPSTGSGSPGQSTQSAPTGLTASSIKTPSKKPGAGQKKSAETTPAQQPPSKKQKVSAGEPDQSIDQLNDVTAVSGVNLKEEEEQLLIGPKEESRTTEAMRKIVQEEEERLFLEKGPLRAKVAAIASRCGVKSVSEDVGRCLSMSVEERLRSMLYKLVKLSKQRCDYEKDRHKVAVTSDVRRQILLLKRKAKEMLDKKLAEESDRLRKLNEKKDKGSLPEVEREELKAKAQKAQQEEEDRLKANAANVAARAAVGADDMLLKWQMMAEHGRKKRQGGESGAAEETTGNRAGSSADGVSATHSDKKLENGSDSTGVGPGSADTDTQGPLTASATGRPPGPGTGGNRLLSARRMLISRGERAITVKDVIAFLETEPQMSKSTLLYRLYERERKIADGEKGPSSTRK